MPVTTGPDVRASSAASYRETRRRASSRSASRMERPSAPSSSTGRSATRRAGMSAATSILRAPHDAHLDDRAAGVGVEARLAGHQAGVLELVHQLGQRLLVVDPAEELPDGAEVLDVVDERGAGERHQQRARHPGPDALGELEHVLAALRRLVLDEVGLVDDHAAEAVVAEPADVPVEHLVVDHHDVGEPVDLLAVAVDHGDGAVRGPEADLARPVGLDHVGDHAQQRVGVGGLRGHQGLRGLAEAGLVGQQEGAVALRGRGDQLLLVRHEGDAGGAGRVGRREGHAGAGPAPDVLEGLEQRLEQLPVGQPSAADPLELGGGEVGAQERVGEPAGDDGLGGHAARRGGRGGVGLGRLELLGRVDAGLLEHLPAQRPGAVGDLGVLGQQLQQRGVARGGLGQDRGDPVQALELLPPAALGDLGVGVEPGALLADQQGHDLEGRAAVGHHLAALGGLLDLAHGAREHRDDALVVHALHLGAATPLPGLALRGLASASLSHSRPPRMPGVRTPDNVAARVLPGATLSPGPCDGDRPSRVAS